MDYHDMAESARYASLPALPRARLADMRHAERLEGARPIGNDTRVAVWRSRFTPEQRVDMRARGNRVREPFLALWREPMRKRA